MRWFSRSTTATPKATGDDQQHAVLGNLAGGFIGLGQKIEAHHGGHDAAGEGQKQADGAVRLAFEQGATKPPSPVPPAPEMSVTNVTNANGDSVSIANRLP